MHRDELERRAVDVELEVKRGAGTRGIADDSPDRKFSDPAGREAADHAECARPAARAPLDEVRPRIEAFATEFEFVHVADLAADFGNDIGSVIGAVRLGPPLQPGVGQRRRPRRNDTNGAAGGQRRGGLPPADRPAADNHNQPARDVQENGQHW